MFKNVMVYRIGEGWRPSLADAEQALQAARFVECGPTQDKSVGWTEPRGQAHGPLLESVARLSTDHARLTPDAAGQRLAALGFADSQGALRHLEALTGGVSRRAVIQRTLLPVMLQFEIVMFVG